MAFRGLPIHQSRHRRQPWSKNQNSILLRQQFFSDWSRVIVAMGPHSSFAVEVSNRFRVDNAITSTAFPTFQRLLAPSGYECVAQLASLGVKTLSAYSPWEPVGQSAWRVPHLRRQTWPHSGKRHLDTVGLGQTRNGWSLSYRFFAPGIVQATRGRALADPADEMPPGVFPCDHVLFEKNPGCGRNVRWVPSCFWLWLVCVGGTKPFRLLNI